MEKVLKVSLCFYCRLKGGRAFHEVFLIANYVILVFVCSFTNVFYVLGYQKEGRTNI